MGGGSSKTENTIKVVNEAITNVINKTAQTCAAQVKATQTFRIHTTGPIVLSGVDISQRVQVDLKCLQQASNKVKIGNELKNKLEQIAQSVTGAISLGDAKAKNVSNITNKITNTVQNEIIQQVIASVEMNQNVDLSAGGPVILININVDQFGRIILEAIQNNDNLTTAINQFANTVNQESSAESKGVLGTLLGPMNLAIYAMIIIGIIIVIAIAIILIMLLRK